VRWDHPQRVFGGLRHCDTQDPARPRVIRQTETDSTGRRKRDSYKNGLVHDDAGFVVVGVMLVQVAVSQ